MVLKEDVVMFMSASGILICRYDWGQNSTSRHDFTSAYKSRLSYHTMNYMRWRKKRYLYVHVCTNDLASSYNHLSRSEFTPRFHISKSPSIWLSPEYSNPPSQPSTPTEDHHLKLLPRASKNWINTQQKQRDEKEKGTQKLAGQKSNFLI
jgi:hypothetical protein